MLLLEAISLAYLFTYLLLLSSPLQGEALFLLLLVQRLREASGTESLMDGVARSPPQGLSTAGTCWV